MYRILAQREKISCVSLWLQESRNDSPWNNLAQVRSEDPKRIYGLHRNKLRKANEISNLNITTLSHLPQPSVSSSIEVVVTPQSAHSRNSEDKPQTCKDNELRILEETVRRVLS